MEQKDIDKFQEKFPFLTGLNYGGKEHVGIVQNYNNQLTTIYDFDKLRTEEDKQRFLELGETWWWESNRIVPINIFLPKEMEYFKYSLCHMITKDVDFMIRAKRMEPFKCNAGMIWVKNTKKNLEIIEEWEDVARRMKITGPNQFILLEKYYEKGLYWSGQGAGIDQLGLNVIIQKYKNEINYQTFPEKFNGISTNEKSLICHMKGPEKHKYFNKRTNELQ